LRAEFGNEGDSIPYTAKEQIFSRIKILLLNPLQLNLKITIAEGEVFSLMDLNTKTSL